MSQKKQNLLFLTIVAALFVALCISLWFRAKRLGKISFLDHLDETAVTIDGADYPFRDLAVYLAKQERTVEEQANAYDLENSNAYWNLHTNGSFIRIEARDAAMDQAVHDIIFSQSAAKEGIQLTKEETVFLENQKQDFWNDLEENGQERLGVSEQEITQAFSRIALAQKYQQMLAALKGVDNVEYNVNGANYQELLGEHDVSIHEKLWERLNFGNITIH